MECKVNTDKLTLCECLPQVTAEVPFDAEPSLPDYCPDIGKVLRCRAVPVLSTREARSGKAVLGGVIKLYCMYADGKDKALRCFEHRMPFTAEVPYPRLGEDSAIFADVRAAYVNCRALSQRKLDIHGALAVCVRAETCVSAELMTSAQGAGVRTRCEKVRLSGFEARRSAEFTVSETLELGQGKPPVLSVVRSSAGAVMTECKPVANKLIVKGEISIGTVYDTAVPGAVESMEWSLPFSQFIDLSGVGDTSDVDISVEAADAVLVPRADADGEYRVIAADIRVSVNAAAYEDKEISVVTDAYSVCCELDIERKKLTAEHLAARAGGGCTASCRLETSREIEKVLDSWCEINGVSAECRDDGSGPSACVRGSAAGCAVVRLSDGDLEYLEAPMDFSSETALPGPCGTGRCTAQAVPRGCVCSIAAANRLEIRADIDTVATLREDVAVNSVASIKPDESRPRRAEERPAAVLYFGEAGEELWSIAREHSARAEDIAADNAVDGARLDRDELLLIVINGADQ